MKEKLYGSGEADAFLSEKFPELCQRRYNWGGKGELPVREHVTSDLDRHYTVMISQGGLPRPDVHLRADGSVFVSWGWKSRRFSLRFPCENIVCWARRDHAGYDVAGFHNTNASLDDIKAEINEGFRWLMDQK